MQTESIPLLAPAPGTRQALTVHRFGTPGARPFAYVQAALHADEMPGVIAALALRERLAALDAQGLVRGEIVLVPFANPVGLAQRVLGGAVGRFDLADGGNFNRHFARLGPDVADAVAGRLGMDATANAMTIRAALAAAVVALPAMTPAQDLKRTLLRLAIGADLVLDLHCDSEAVMHLYTLTPQAEAFAPLTALLGCEAVLLAEESGDDPFDEACSRSWLEIARRHPDRPVPTGCLATTVELRGQADVDTALAEKDAAALLGYLALCGVVEATVPPIPAPRCAPTPLAGSEPLIAPVSGLVAYRRRPGDHVSEGDVVAEILDPETGHSTPVAAPTSGLLYARSGSRFAYSGKRLGKVAGTTIRRTGKLLSP